MVTSTSEKYDKILQAAIEVITEKGLDKTSISDIVKRAGVAQGTFYLYFRSKNALVPAIAENLLSLSLEKIKERAKAATNFLSILEVMIDETYKTTDEYRDVLVLCYSGLAFDYSLETWEAIYLPYYNWFEEVLNEAVKKEEVIKQLNVKWTAKTMINLIENAAELFYIGREQDVTLEQSKEELFQFLKRSLVPSV
ncbi:MULTISPECIES: TetR family transcriptional regulator [Priestia]|uniref:TetR family transcriptional regulator n=1 Tax=Priestia TaxID=2800373 RepID=UPI000BED3F25|nr:MULTISPECIES: TetR family transcriptional regulator [Priestia]MDP9725012.1 AcrR family transcriptional regulator [Priestia aryabhattai]MED3868206.1 TetR family transcriptional regulator [Priestia megaterium]MED4024845.1 TetR family transcriptional regulator [Priestia megaterium]MED4139562.1 TetR family transcriptional regulator [Priestia megaterium]PEA37865.1 TetR family transcriptional regulator [Priestia megaterium]